MIIVKNLIVSYESLKVIDGFSYTFNEHEITALHGPSGCGKTTLLNAMSGLVNSDGTITISDRISYIFQEDRLLPWKTVYENVAYVLNGLFSEDDKHKRIIHHLELVGLKDVMDEYPSKLSGGMKRRVSIARAFAFPSDVLLMDEPFKGLDKALKAAIMDDFLALWHQDKRTVVIVTHDEEEAERLSHKVVHLTCIPMEIASERMVKTSE